MERSIEPFTQFLTRASRWCTPVFLAGVSGAFLLRALLLQKQTVDYLAYTGRWYGYLESNGGFFALDRLEANYTPAYLYLLAFVVSVPHGVSDVIAIKLITLPFDLLLAWGVYLIIGLKYPAGWVAPLGALAVLFAPTVVLNGAYWGQTDAIYTSALIGTVYLIVTRRPAWAMIAFGIAISFKLQAVFLAPLLLALIHSRQLPLRHTLLIPLPFLAFAIPALILGRTARDTLLAYVDQAGVYEVLTKNAPNLYQWVPNGAYDLAYPLGVGLTVVVTLLFVAAVRRHRALLSTEDVVLIATASLVFVPFLLPKMHERYFFPADVMAIVLGCYFPRLLWVPVVVIGSSLAAYIPFISIADVQTYVEREGVGSEPIPLPLVAVFMGVVAVFLVQRAVRTARPGSG